MYTTGDHHCLIGPSLFAGLKVLSLTTLEMPCVTKVTTNAGLIQFGAQQ